MTFEHIEGTNLEGAPPRGAAAEGSVAVLAQAVVEADEPGVWIFADHDEQGPV